MRQFKILSWKLEIVCMEGIKAANIQQRPDAFGLSPYPWSNQVKKLVYFLLHSCVQAMLDPIVGNSIFKPHIYIAS
ncbi:MAG: hypothetical protein ACLUAO_00500 [Streptococcus sp.]